jgi:hypothetical protein
MFCKMISDWKIKYGHFDIRDIQILLLVVMKHVV